MKFPSLAAAASALAASAALAAPAAQASDRCASAGELIYDLASPLFVIGLFLLPALVFYLAHLRARAGQKLVQAQLDRGETLDRDTLLVLLARPPRHRQDLRRSGLLLASAAGCGLAGIALGDQDLLRPMLATAAVFAAFGLLYLFYARFLKDDA